MRKSGKKYHRFWEDDQAGAAIIAYEKALEHRIVVIKQRMPAATKEELKQLKKVSHPNIVELLEVYTTVSSVFLVYEDLLVSLHQIQATNRGELTEIEMATICKEAWICLKILFIL